MRLEKRGLLLSIIIWLPTFLGVAMVTGDPLNLPLIIALAATVFAHFLVALVEWIFYEPLGSEYVQTKLALRQAELTFGMALGELSSKRSPRKWWKPLYSWQLKRKLARRPTAST